MAISQITSNSIAAGAVSASDLADGSITTAKIADSNITPEKLSTSVGARLVKRAYSSGLSVQTTTTAFTSYADMTGTSVSYTPLATGNTLLIRMKACPSIYTAGGASQYFGVSVRINCNGSYSDVAGFWHRTDNGSTEIQSNIECTMKYVTTGTSTITIKGEWKSNIRSGTTTAGIGQWYSTDNTGDANFIEILEFQGSIA